MNEIWKDIKGYEGLYQVSNLGRVKRFYQNNNLIKKPSDDKDGYLIIGLWKEGKRKTFKVHRLVAEAFIKNTNNYPCINHKDEDPKNNLVDNLEWCTVEYNNNYGNRKKKTQKPILQYSKDGKFIKEWESISLAQRELNLSSLSQCCQGKAKTRGGYIWRYKKILD